MEKKGENNENELIPDTPSKEHIIATLLSNCTEEFKGKAEKLHSVNKDSWTIADLFIRQHMNNMCDGFGMVNVTNMYNYLVSIKHSLIEYNLLSKTGYNNSGYKLWDDYNIEPAHC